MWIGYSGSLWESYYSHSVLYSRLCSIKDSTPSLSKSPICNCSVFGQEIERKMEEMPSLWGYQEIIDELKQKLLYTTVELETVRAQASEEMKKHKEYVKESLQLLKMTIQERDEARDQFHKLLNKLMIPSKTPNAELLSTFPQLPPPESPLMKPTRANSSITESNSLSEPYNYQSQNSSPVDSFFDAISPPELPNINHHIGDASNNNIAFMNQPFVLDYSGTVATNHVLLGVPKIDQAPIIIDNLVKGKTLPQKGSLLQAVLEAGPLLQTLLVAGPLPRWRNPPPLQTLHIPPVSIKGCEAENIGQKPDGNLSNAPRPLNSQPFVELSCGTSQMMSTSMLNFVNGNLSPSVGNERLIISAGAKGNNFVPTGKRQRFR